MVHLVFLTMSMKKKLTHVNFAQKLVDEKPKKNSFLDGLLNC